MVRNHTVVVGSVLALLVAGPAVAAERYAADDPPRPLFVFASGGGFSPTLHLDTSGTTKFRTGWSLGGGLGYELGRHLSVRGTFQFIRAKAQDLSLGNISGLDGAEFDRYVYTAEIEGRYPLTDRIKVYALLGGGGISIQDTGLTTGTTFTRGVGKAGAGLSYQIPRSQVSVFIQGNGLLYKWVRYGFTRNQFDTTWVGGAMYRFRM